MLLRHLCRSLHDAPPRQYIVQTFLDAQLSTLSRPSSQIAHPRLRRTPLSRVLRSSSASIYTLIAVAAVFAAGSSLFLQGQVGQATPPSPPAAPEECITVPPLKVMSGRILPGRPGNLTAEQEAKLKELWVAVLLVFGVATPADGLNGSDSLEKAKAEANGSVKEKKKRVNLFGKKNKADGSDGTVIDGSADANDKWGQTKEFQNVLANQSPDDIRRAYWSMVKHDHPDGLLLRFLRARKWDVHSALVMMIATMHWRLQEMHVDDDIMRRGEGGAVEDSQSADTAVKKEGLDFLAQERLGKSFIHGTDREGRPMCFVRTRLHKQGQQSEASLERYTVFVIETARLMLSPPVDTAVSLGNGKREIMP